MSKAVVFGVGGALVSVAMLALGFVAGNRTDLMGSASPAAQSALNRQQVEEIVRDYLVSNPEILGEMQVALEDRERGAQEALQKETITSASDQIFNAAYDGVVGNPEGRVTIVEFFDYNCGYCKRAYEDMEAMVASDPDLRFVLKEFPILGPDSQKAHVVSMAFRSLAPEKYGEFHRALLMGQRATEAGAVRAAVDLGVDEAALREEMKNPAIMQAFSETYDLATRLSISGTPSYVVGNEVVFGALGRMVLAEKVDAARATN